MNSDHKFSIVAMSNSLLRQSALLMVFMLGWASTAQADIPTAERAALIDIYNSTNGASWTNNSGWNGAAGTECTWQGITCAQVCDIHFSCSTTQFNVSWIKLPNNNLVGTLPSLSGLTALKYLDVSANQLTGLIPSLSGLTGLSYFNVSNNQLTGSIPPLSALSALKNFYVAANKLTGPVPAPPTSLIAGGSTLCGNSLVSSGSSANDAAWGKAVYNLFGGAGSNWLACQIPLNAQTIGTISFSPTTLAVGGTTTASATASSGLAVSFSSTTPNICTVTTSSAAGTTTTGSATTGSAATSSNVTSSTVTGIATGTCIIAADQAGGGNTSYSAAPQVTQPITVAPSVITVSKLGTGSGTVTSADGSINCGSTCSATYNSISAVTLTASPDSGSTFVGWNGGCTGTGTCAVSMGAAQNVTATFNIVPFTAVTTGVTAGIITTPTATVTATVTFNKEDAGKPQSVYITAWVPLNTLSPAQQTKVARYTTLVKPLGATSSTTFVLVQLTQSGWQPVVNGQLIPYVSGVTSAQAAALKILDNTSTANLLGSQFCVGYGTSASDMTSAGRMQLVATVPNPNATKSNTGSCNIALPISGARAFAYAAANYPDYLPGTPVADQITYQGNHYDYRYYPSTQNLLAVDTSGVVWFMGQASGGKLQAIGPLESFRNIITNWEGAQ